MKINFTFLFLLFCSVAFSQSPIELLPSDTSLIELNTDISNEWEEFHLRMDLKNTSSDTLLMIWRKDMSDCPVEWETIIADPQQHFLHFVTSNFDTALNINLPVVLLPSQVSQFGFNVELYPNSVPGCCTIPLYISLLENVDSIINTAYFRFAINDPSCDFVNDVEKIKKKISVYPNPSNGTVFIKSETPIYKIEVVNLYGVLLKRELNKDQIDIGDLPKGIYIFKIEFPDGKLFFQKIKKS